MREIIKMGIILMAVCIVSAGALSAVYNVTKIKIDENVRLSDIKKRQEVLPSAVNFIEKEIKGKKLWTGIDKDGKEVGVVIKVSPRGYASPINTTIGIGSDDSVSSVAITKLDQTETPGLGVKVTQNSFKDQFKGKKGEELKLKKDGGTIDAITAATISSRAVANGIKEGWEWYMEARSQKSEVRSQK
ncbi:MAG: RnfABCDGE type electron transport complex subunit G [Nitrospinae bacterium]|nr:RnfABCDGE type electron transport complex subunit G [Nitrospinota bacterium]